MTRPPEGVVGGNRLDRTRRLLPLGGTPVHRRDRGRRRGEAPDGAPPAHGLQLTGVSVAPGTVRLTGTLPEWRTELPRKRLEDVTTQLSVPGVVLNLTRLGWPR